MGSRFAFCIHSLFGFNLISNGPQERCKLIGLGLAFLVCPSSGRHGWPSQSSGAVRARRFRSGFFWFAPLVAAVVVIALRGRVGSYVSFCLFRFASLVGVGRHSLQEYLQPQPRWWPKGQVPH